VAVLHTTNRTSAGTLSPANSSIYTPKPSSLQDWRVSDALCGSCLGGPQSTQLGCGEQIHERV
jgi:hypothetical protein